MDSVFKETLRTNRVVLVNSMDVEPLLPYMIQKGIFSTSHAELINSRPTIAAKASEFLSLLVRRGPNAKQVFLDALLHTGQSHLLSEYACHQQHPTSTNVFRNLVDELAMLSPGKKITERHGVILLTSTRTYMHPPPESSLGEREIPYLLAVAGCGYSEQAVLSWPAAPTKAEFNKSYEIYKQEIAETRDILKMLNHGGLHLLLKPNDERISKLISVYNRDCVLGDGTINLCIEAIDTSMIAPRELDILACILHLTCFTPSSFIIRKSVIPQPHCYLLCSPNPISDSKVIIQSDRQYVQEALNMIEFTLPPSTVNHACPW